MPSRADWRRGVERALRAALVALLAVALWRSVRASRPGPITLTAHSSDLREALVQATTTDRAGRLSVDVDGSLSRAQRDWLAALRRAGVQVSWRGAPPSLAASAGRSREPVARVRIRVLTDSARTIVVSDSVGVIDSVHAAPGAALDASDVVGAVTARAGNFAATADALARSERRDVLVLGRAGWESRFVLAALGEAGWHVRGRLPVAPGVSVSDASLLPIDTARYDVVITLDSTAADLGPAVARFVGQGGGAIVLGSALEIGALRGVVPARASERRPGRILLEGDTLTRADLPIRPLVGARLDAIALERQPSGLAVAIRRAGRGRVAAVGYDESWRWRMQGGEGGAAAHRAWWSRVAGLVAPERSPASAVAAASEADPAPRASLFEALGPPTAAANLADHPASNRLPLLLLVLALAALLAETASRRFRGAS